MRGPYQGPGWCPAQKGVIFCELGSASKLAEYIPDIICNRISNLIRPFAPLVLWGVGVRSMSLSLDKRDEVNVSLYQMDTAKCDG